MPNLENYQVDVFPGINDAPVAPTQSKAGNGSHLIKQFNDSLAEIDIKFTEIESQLNQLSASIFLPIVHTHWHEDSIVVSGNNLAIDVRNDMLHNVGVFQSPAQLGDRFKFDAVLQAGTYLCRIAGLLNSYHGILFCYLNEAELFNNMDWYASSNENAIQEKTIIIPTSGIQRFVFAVYDKNADSQDYYMVLSKISLIKLVEPPPVND